MSRRRTGLEAALLREARSQLATRGWSHAGDFADEDGALSLDGALNAAVTGRPDMPSEGSAVVEGLLLDVLASRGYDGTLADWNVEPGRTLDDIYALLDDAIDPPAAKENLP